jgi:glycosyltransferase involved in cell wall biosynthesis
MVLKQFKEKYEHKAVDHFPTQVKNNPMVSVCVVTYNHVNYIKQCLDGILNQKIDFDVEILLGDDASTDGTREICVEYARKYPDKIKLFLHHRENNIKIGGKPTGRFNFLYNLYSAQGKYIALCDGDDYWTDAAKLQMQVVFLENNCEYEMCFTNTRIIDDLGNVKHEEFIKGVLKTTYHHKDMPIWSPALTRVFKNRDFNILNGKVPGVDDFMLVYQSTLGKIKYFKKITSSYRVHDKGIYSLISRAKKYEHKIKTNLACLHLIHKEFKKQYLGQILKDLIDLKLLDKKLFNKNAFYVSKTLEEIKKSPRVIFLLFTFYFHIIKTPLIYKSEIFRKSINKVLINKHK